MQLFVFRAFQPEELSSMNKEMIALFCDKLQQLERDLACCLKSETECCGVSMAQCQSLLEIAKQEETSVGEVAANLGLDTSTLSRMINNLVNLGLVNRVLNPEDRRYVSLTLTDQGKKVCGSIEESITNYVAKIFELIPAEKQQQVVENVAILADVINKCNQQFPACRDLINQLKME
jgi:DNA-binding MarR family transcriptional regulator